MTPTAMNRSALIAGGVILAIAAYLFGTSHASSASAATPTTAVAASGVQTLSARSTSTTSNVTSGGITVTGTGTVKGVPDSLTLSMSTNVTSSSIDDALARSNSTATAIIDALKGKGVAEADLATTNLNIQPNYTSSGTPDGYVVSQSITAKIHGLGRAGQTISAAISAGGNNARVDGVNMSIDDTDPLAADARAAAIKDARSHAEQFAQAAGAHVGQVESISESVVSAPPMPLYSTAGAAMDSKASYVPIQAGTQDVTIQVTVVYALA